MCQQSSEIKALLQYDSKSPRTRSQLIATIKGRIDTGQKNVTAIQKQLMAAERRLADVVTRTAPSMQGEQADQEEELMDIFEELDEDGNVVSSRIVNASKDKKELQELLVNKGLADIAGKESKGAPIPAAKHKTPRSDGSLSDGGEAKVVSSITNRSSTAIKKAPPPSRTHPTQRMLFLDDNDNVIDSKPLELIQPREDTSKEDEEMAIAQFREASANAQEIAPIVATFDLEPDSSSEVDSDAEDYESEQSENEYGMGTIASELTDDYKTEMESLMRKHAVAMQNAGPNYNPEILKKLDTAHRDTGLVAKAPSPDNSASKKDGIKGVRFAENLDISPGPDHAATHEDPQAIETEHPVSETVLERTLRSQPEAGKIRSTRKPSRFKTSMNAVSNTEHNSNDTVAGSSSNSASMMPSNSHGIKTKSPVERPKKVSRFKAAHANS